MLEEEQQPLKQSTDEKRFPYCPFAHPKLEELSRKIATGVYPKLEVVSSMQGDWRITQYSPDVVGEEAFYLTEDEYCTGLLLVRPEATALKRLWYMYKFDVFLYHTLTCERKPITAFGHYKRTAAAVNRRAEVILEEINKDKK